MLKKIAVIGATGMIGTPVTRELIRAGMQVTIIARDRHKAAKFFPEATIAEADVFDPLSLLKALEGQDAVYISLSPPKKATLSSLMPEREGLNNIIDVSKHLGIKRILFLSSLVQRYNGMNGFNWWIFEMKNASVANIRKSGIPYTIFYPSTFMETFKRDLIKGNKIMLTSGSIAPMWFIAGEDFGKQVVRAIEQNSDTNTEYDIQGPEPYTWDEAAAVIKNNAGKKMTILKAPLDILKVLSFFARPLNYAWHICEALNNYPEKFTSANSWKELGTPQKTLADFAKTV